MLRSLWHRALRLIPILIRPFSLSLVKRGSLNVIRDRSPKYHPDITGKQKG